MALSTARCLSRCLFAGLLVTPLLLSGCAAQKRLIAQQAQTIDSLQVVQRTMRSELYALQDSIVFYDDIDSGLYYRKQRALEDRIIKLEYLLAVRRDSLCALETVETLLADDLFKRGITEISDGGQETLAALALHLDTTYAHQRFRVEGHSDNVPVGGQFLEKYPSNWELSGARAAAVVRFFIEAHGFDASRFEMTALGDAHPAAPNNTANGRRRNRRIQIYILPD